MDDECLYNIGDTLLVKADRAITPDMRFWVCQLMNITCCKGFPNINADDPVSVPGAPRWFKVWWYESTKEYGTYNRRFHYVGGVRQRSLSWEKETTVLMKLANGLTKRRTIRNYPKYRRQIEYNVKKAYDQLQGEEDVGESPISDSMTREKAITLVSRIVSRPSDDGSEEELTGRVVGFREPLDDDHDKRIYFEVAWDEGGTEMVVGEELEDFFLVSED
jgi:hypothetical protein